jgi:hypothetical protein
MEANDNTKPTQSGSVPVDQFKPEVGKPQLYDVTVIPSWLKYGFHIDMEAKIADFLIPEGVTVSFFWDYDPDKAPKGKTLAPVLWCKAGYWKTPWRNGKPDLHELRVHDLEHPDSKVRFEAVRALHALYVPVCEQYEAALWEVHVKMAEDYSAKLGERSKHSPTLTSEEIAARTQDHSWWPEDYLAEKRRRYGY